MKKGRKKKFTEEQEPQICNDYFSEEKPSIYTLAKKWNCVPVTIRNVIIGNGYVLRTQGETLKGIKRSEEVKRKISKTEEGKIVLEETKEKMSISHIGQKAWNKGLTKETDERVKKSSESHIGQLSWNKEKTGVYSLETLKKMREKALFRIKNQYGPFKDTKPELAMKKILNELNISFEHQFRLGNHLFDFHLLDTNILIEVDGDYYHGNSKKFYKLNKMQLKQKERDVKNKKLAKNSNYVLLRFWESDILKNAEKVKSVICSKIVR